MGGTNCRLNFQEHISPFHVKKDVFPVVSYTPEETVSDADPAQPEIERGYGTPRNSLILLARLERLERPTRCLEGSCSIHLSYRRTRPGL